jgi:hypothetical protein
MDGRPVEIDAPERRIVFGRSPRFNPLAVANGGQIGPA